MTTYTLYFLPGLNNPFDKLYFLNVNDHIGFSHPAPAECKFAFHKDWMAKQGIEEVGSIHELNLPEQGIQGPNIITSIKHILPQKKPVDEDPDDDYEYRPVTGIFVHTSDDVWMLHFDTGDSLGVTSNHPLFSVTYNDWLMARELLSGDSILAKKGNVRVCSSEKKKELYSVYNIEVKEYHNFLVSNNRIVVHNGCWSSILQKYGKGANAVYQTAISHIWDGHNPLSKIEGKSYFKSSLDDQLKLKKYITAAPSKGSLISTNVIERTVDGVKREFMESVYDMGENVGKLRNHVDDTDIITIVYDITDKNISPYVNASFPGLPNQ